MDQNKQISKVKFKAAFLVTLRIHFACSTRGKTQGLAYFIGVLADFTPPKDLPDVKGARYLAGLLLAEFQLLGSGSGPGDRWRRWQRMTSGIMDSSAPPEGQQKQSKSQVFVFRKAKERAAKAVHPNATSSRPHPFM